MKNLYFIGNSPPSGNRILAKIRLLSITALFFFGSSQATEELPRQAYLPLDVALAAASEALKKCSADGHRVSVAVVNRSGVLLVVLRDPNAGPHTLDSSSRKAFTAASLGRSTRELANFIKDKPELHGLRDMHERILILAGGLPISVGGELVGGIGVGGAPGGELDETCAQSGINSLAK